MGTFDEEREKERVHRIPFVRLLGMRLLSCGGGKSTIRCPMRRCVANSAGTFHGGAMGALVDMSVATALRSVVPPALRITTVEYKVNLLKPVPGGSVTAHGSVIRVGRTLAVGSTEIRNDAGEPVAFGSATFYLLESLPSAGSAKTPPSGAGSGGRAPRVRKGSAASGERPPGARKSAR